MRDKSPLADRNNENRAQNLVSTLRLWYCSRKGKPNAFLRGGNWNNETNAGAFALNLNNSPTNTNNNIGFRCASDQQSARMEWYVFKDTYPASKDHQVFSCLRKKRRTKCLYSYI